MIGGATVIGIGPRDRYVTPDMARIGDIVILTKGAAIEAAGLFAVNLSRARGGTVREKAAREAEEIFWQMSIVEDAFRCGGGRREGRRGDRHARRDRVRGVGRPLRGRPASGVGMTIDKEKIIVQEAVRNVCDLFGIDPYTSISEGTLILTCGRKGEGSDRRLGDKGNPASMVGEIVDSRQGMRFFENGTSHELIHPKVDPFWAPSGKRRRRAADRRCPIVPLPASGGSTSSPTRRRAGAGRTFRSPKRRFSAEQTFFQLRDKEASSGRLYGWRCNCASSPAMRTSPSS